jgi:hypothetical protein
MSYIRYHLQGHYGSYTIKDTVLLSDEDERDPKDVLWAKYRRQGLLSLPMASKSLKVVDKEELPDEDE